MLVDSRAHNHTLHTLVGRSMNWGTCKHTVVGNQPHRAPPAGAPYTYWNSIHVKVREWGRCVCVSLQQAALLRPSWPLFTFMCLCSLLDLRLCSLWWPRGYGLLSSLAVRGTPIILLLLLLLFLLLSQPLFLFFAQVLSFILPARSTFTSDPC